jgi:hypothetical protein
MTSVNANQEALLDELLKDYTNPQDIRAKEKVPSYRNVAVA